MKLYKKFRACFDYFFQVVRHKYIVYKTGKHLVSTSRLIWHDMSKFKPDEFFPYAYYFCGEIYGLEKNFESMRKAWNLHKSRNEHHWEYWAEFDETGSWTISNIPDEVLKEMVADWLAACYTYNNKGWPKSLYEWDWWLDEGKEVCNSILNQDTKIKLQTLLNNTMDSLSSKDD